MIDWSKTLSAGFDEVRISSHRSSEWVDFEIRVGKDVERVRFTLRSTEALRDLHYALGRYLHEIDLERIRRDREK